jgi:hypothetical protein
MSFLSISHPSVLISRMAIQYLVARLIRSQSILISVSHLGAFLPHVNAINSGADFFEAQQSQACQIYTVIESPIFISTFIPSNTVLSNPTFGYEITVTNAPTMLSATVTVSTTLGQDALSASANNSPSTSSRNPRFPA